MEQDISALLDGEGREKYLHGDEIAAYLKACETLRPQPRAFCLTLFYTGARRSEALALRRRDIDLEKGRVAILTLKQRKEGDKPQKPKWRRVPVPAEYTKMMDLVFDLKRGNGGGPLWLVCRRQATRWVKTVMEAAGTPHHSPHTLRHTFGVMAAMRGVPIPNIQRWLGHAHATTTSIYTTAGGVEEDELVRRMWE